MKVTNKIEIINSNTFGTRIFEIGSLFEATLLVSEIGTSIELWCSTEDSGSHELTRDFMVTLDHFNFAFDILDNE